MRIRDVALKTDWRRWTIGRSGVRGSGISLLAAWHDDDNDTFHNDMTQRVNVISRLDFELIMTLQSNTPATTPLGLPNFVSEGICVWMTVRVTGCVRVCLALLPLRVYEGLLFVTWNCINACEEMTIMKY